jgi:hypothetical protein
MKTKWQVSLYKKEKGLGESILAAPEIDAALPLNQRSENIV